MSLLMGVHDREGAQIVPDGGWVVDTVALSENPTPQDYDTRLNWLVRLNWGYGSTGTIPLPDKYPEYTSKALEYIFRSSGAHGYIIGNEPNHQAERPDGTIITPNQYSWLFSKVRNTVKSSLPETRIITAGLAPYHANPIDWLFYLKTMLQLIANNGGTDGISLHAYTRGSHPSDISSPAQMGAPLVGQFSGFRVYQNALSAVPSSLRDSPVYITEFNPIPDWEDTNSGVVKAAYKEIQEWNAKEGKQKVSCLVLFRWNSFPGQKYGIQDKPGVLADFREAISMGQPASIPVLSPFTRSIDPRATQRGVSIVQLVANVSSPIWKVVKIQWLNEEESQGRHHIFFDTLDEAGNRVSGVPILVTWPTGYTTVISESKSGELYSANFPLSPSRNEFSVIVSDSLVSEMVRGIGMGQEYPEGYNKGVHTSTVVVFQRVAKGDEPPVPSVSAPKPVARPVPALIHPVADPAFRQITQRFGENPENYDHFKVDGVALKGHNGLDFATPIGSVIVAVAAGRVVEVAEDESGYGLYVKLSHFWGESLYAHLSMTSVVEGGQVIAGSSLGNSGSSGNVTGPHLHFALRVSPFNRADGWGGFTDPFPYLTSTQVSPTGIMEAIRIAAKESSLEWQLLASLAWAESSFRPQILDGLFQIGDAAWSDWAKSVGAINKNDPLDNARVGAAYLKWLIKYLDGDISDALTAYNWGIQNVLDELPVPEMTKTYVAKVIHGRDLLKATGG